MVGEMGGVRSGDGRDSCCCGGGRASIVGEGGGARFHYGSSSWGCMYIHHETCVGSCVAVFELCDLLVSDIT